MLTGDIKHDLTLLKKCQELTKQGNHPGIARVKEGTWNSHAMERTIVFVRTTRRKHHKESKATYLIYSVEKEHYQRENSATFNSGFDIICTPLQMMRKVRDLDKC